VRRRLRHLALEGHRRHQRRLLWWSLAMLPQLPLMVLACILVCMFGTVPFPSNLQIGHTFWSASIEFISHPTIPQPLPPLFCSVACCCVCR
jgi:hypothetical protein